MSATKKDRNVTLGDVMTRDVEVIRPDASLQEAAERMKRLGVGSLPVCNGDRIVGMLTDRDIIIRATAAGQHPEDTRVQDTMTGEVAYCFDDQRAEDGARLMEEKQIRRLPIVNREKQLVGIVSLGDLSQHLTNEQRTGEVLKEISRPGSQPGV